MTCFGHNPHQKARGGCLAGVVLVALPWIVAALVASLCVTACGDARQPPVEPPPAIAPLPSVQPELAEDATPLQRAQARVDQLDRERGAAIAERDIARAAEQQARLDGLRRIGWWVAGIAVLGVFASVALAIVLPVGRKMAISAGIACAVVLVMALGFDRMLPYLPAIGLLLIVAGAAWGIWQLVIWKRATREAAAHGDRLETALTEWADRGPMDTADLLDVVKQLSAGAQERAGVRKLVAAVRRKPVKPIAPLAVQ